MTFKHKIARSASDVSRETNMQTANAETASEPGFSPEQTAQALLNLRCAVDHCHDVVLITDADGRIEFVNPSFRDVTGFAASEVLGQKSRVIHEPIVQRQQHIVK
jgi:PAS domain-containing protein